MARFRIKILDGFGLGILRHACQRRYRRCARQDKGARAPPRQNAKRPPGL